MTISNEVRNAICRIDVVRFDGTPDQGTGTLVADGIVLTALHVVADRHTIPPRPCPKVTLTFPHHKTEALIRGSLFDPSQDWALLTCKVPPSARPVRIGELLQPKVQWDTYGFPSANPRDGMQWSGQVEMCQGDLEGVTVLQLFSHQAAAGDGGPVKGLSGAPVIVDGWLVGHMRFALLKEGRTVAGTIYACPAIGVVERCPDVLRIAPVPQHRSTHEMLRELRSVAKKEANCGHCGKDVDEEAVRCPACGKEPSSGKNCCTRCGASRGQQQDFCSSCGVSFHPLDGRVLANHLVAAVRKFKATIAPSLPALVARPEVKKAPVKRRTLKTFIRDTIILLVFIWILSVLFG